MIRVENRLGRVEISNEYFADLVSHTASGCFGVSGMVASGASQGLRLIAGAEVPDKGVLVRAENGALVVELHIEVAYGLNISAVAKSIVEEVHYAVEQSTGLKVSRVSVCVDAMKCE
ncbi:MAG: Asp23/Gls24 family envelope stress response protein [Oscillospiraceae bacterium]